MKRLLYILLLTSSFLKAQTVSIDQNKLKYEGSVQFSGATQTFTTVTGKSYTLVWDLDFASGSSAHGIKVEAFDGANITPFTTSSLYTTSIAGSLDFTANSTTTKIKFSSQAPTGTNMIYYIDGVQLREKLSTNWSLTGAGTLSRSSGILTCSNPGTDEGVKRMYPTIPGHEYEVKVNFLNGDYDVQLKSKAFNGSWHSEESIFFGEQEVTYTFIAQSEQSEIHLLFLRGATNYQYKVDQVKFTDKDDELFVADVSKYSLYYPFGMQEPGMASLGDYRYGFNGKETDDESRERGVQYDYGFRMYDPNIGRPISIDPLTKQYPELSPYQFFSNNPIWFIDLDGLEGVQYLHTTKMKDGTTVTKRVVEVDVYVAISKRKESIHYKSADIHTIQNNLNTEYNNQGFKDKDGNVVEFKFNMNEFDADEISPKERAKQLRLDRGNMVKSVDGLTVQKGFVMERGELEGNRQGSTLGNHVIVSDKARNPAHTQSHEVAHVLAYTSPHNPKTPEEHKAQKGIWKNEVLDTDGNTVISTDPLSKNNVGIILESIPEVESKTVEEK